MTLQDIVEALIAWTPYLATGFGWNMIVSLAAMAIGTAVGVLLAMLRNDSRRAAAGSGGTLTVIANSAPTFVMLFYLAYAIPESFQLFGLTVAVPAWLKASLALGIAVAGYVSDNALLFLPAWTNYFLIIVMASSTASVIGVPELVYRSETVIGALDRPEVAFWVYLYAMCWFLAFSGVATLLMRVLRSHLATRGGGAASQG